MKRYRGLKINERDAALIIDAVLSAVRRSGLLCVK